MGLDCRDAARSLATSMGVDEETAVRLICRMGVIAIAMLKPIVDRLEAPIQSVRVAEIDAEGPRIILRLAETDKVQEVYLDISPDGVELTLSIKAPKNMDKQIVEDAIAEYIEESEAFGAVEEYDVAYNPVDGSIVLTLIAKLLVELPGLPAIVDSIERALARI